MKIIKKIKNYCGYIWVTFSKHVNRFVKRTIILLSDILLNNSLVFKLIGLINEKTNKIATIFIAYPGSDRYASEYTFKFHRKITNNRPMPMGIFKHGDHYGIMFAITKNEDEFEDPKNHDYLQNLVHRGEYIQKLIKANFVKFSGRLPGILHKNKIKRSNSSEIDTTVEIVNLAIRQVIDGVGYKQGCPIIILGGKGHVGSKLEKLLLGFELHIVDIKNGGKASWPHELENTKSILVNLVGSRAFSTFIPKMWKGLVVINESYPEISKEDLSKLTNKGIEAYHIVGVKPHFCFPSFPYPYTGGIPCCAAHTHPSNENRVIIRRLN